MTAISVLPPAFQALHFGDVDEFRPAVRKFDVSFTPIARKISVQQQILNLADFDIVLVESFPRLADMQLAPDCTAVGFASDGEAAIRVNGVDVDRRFVGIGHGGDDFSMIERSGVRLACVVFTPAVHDRGWPQTHGHLAMIVTMVSAQEKLKILTSEILSFAASSPDALAVPATRAALKESLLSAVDQVFERGDLFRPLSSPHFAKAFSIFHKIENAISGDLKSPVYSNELAARVGVSVRTLQDVVLQYRGMSLHRYLRLKRLWLVRRRLLAGHTSVKACALEYGFWHLGDFSRSYRLHFGETPSHTLANGLRNHT